MDYPELFKNLARKVSKQKSFTQETADEIADLVEKGGWLYAVLYFPQPLEKQEEGVQHLSGLKGKFATLDYELANGHYIPMYTSENYSENLADIARMDVFRYPYVMKLSVKEMMEKAKATKCKGVIINPQVERIILTVVS